MSNYGQHFSTRQTPQTDPARADQVKNSAGGFVFALDRWARLERFLILGCEGGSYYASERKLTRENAQTILECLAADGPRTVATIVDVSDRGRAPKNDPAIFALAMAAGDKEPRTRQAALAALPKVCRIGTHLFHFARDVEHFRRWGRGLRTAVAKWYLGKTIDQLGYDLVKYQQRDGWSHKDLLRLAHPHADTKERQALLRYVVAGADGLGVREIKRRDRSGIERVVSYQQQLTGVELPAIVRGFELAKAETNPKTVASLIAQYRLTHEMIPTESKNSPEVWEALLPHMPMHAMVRNLAKMTAVGLLSPLSSASKTVAAALANPDAIRKARLHPIALLSALKVYAQGHGEKGKLSWNADRSIVDALDQAFYLAFETIEPTGKNLLLALDVSGSMAGSMIAGVPGVDARVGAGALAMVTARTEQNWHCVGFTSGAPGEWAGGTESRWSGYRCALTPITISPRQRLDDVCQAMAQLPMGGTDCAQPMLYATEKKLEVDAFIVITDNETWAGKIHPHQALEEYRQKLGRPAKLIVIGMTATEFSIAPQDDAGCMDVVGFDTAAPSVIADFIRGDAKAARETVPDAPQGDCDGPWRVKDGSWSGSTT